jgi:hypothetical protein
VAAGNSLSDATTKMTVMLTTDQKGAIAEAAIALAAIELGVGVARPLAPQRYDFVFDIEQALLRIQC